MMGGDPLLSGFEDPEEFDFETEQDLNRFRDLRDRCLRGEPGKDELLQQGQELAQRSVELRDLIGMELRSLERRLSKSS